MTVIYNPQATHEEQYSDDRGRRALGYFQILGTWVHNAGKQHSFLNYIYSYNIYISISDLQNIK
jgi:hypothetical protein